MKNLIVLVIACFFVQSCKKEDAIELLAPKFKISGHIYNNSNYCGGANPPEELLIYLNTERPTANAKFYIRKGTINKPNTTIYKIISTDSDGLFSSNLPKGKYVAITDEKFNLESNPLMAGCEWLTKPDFKIIVSEENTNLQAHFTLYCNPCLGTPN